MSDNEEDYQGNDGGQDPTSISAIDRQLQALGAHKKKHRKHHKHHHHRGHNHHHVGEGGDDDDDDLDL